MHNPLGFGAADYIELALAALLVMLYVVHPAVEPYLRRLASHTGWSMLVLATLPIALRLALLPHFPIPTPAGSDDFSHLLVAGTLTHFRLANPTHPFHQFFEAIYVMQEPGYSSMYPPGQGMILALGQLLFGIPWAGVLLCGGAFCALCYWMLRAWMLPLWAFAGGLLAVFQFGPLNQWMNTYWTSAIPAVAGCLVFGALARLRTTPNAVLMGVAAGAGLALHLITRPFESILLTVSAALFLPFLPWRTLVRAAMAAMLVLLPAVALLLFQNKAVSGSWTTLPYEVSRYEYGIPATFVMQPNPVPHRQLTPEQDLDYRAQSAIHGDQPETVRSYLERLGYRIRYYRFFVLPPLYLALVAFLVTIRRWSYVWVVAALGVFVLGSNFYPYFYPHYIGATTPLFVLMSVVGLEKLSLPLWSRPSACRGADHRLLWSARLRSSRSLWPTSQSLRLGPLLFLLCTALFLYWYGIRLSGREELFPALAYDEWDFVNHGDPEGRIAINDELGRAPGRQLVFVHYAPQHKFHEWIHNDADIDAARVVWALDLGEAENKKLIAYYSDRHVWMVEPDAQPPTLRRLIY